MPWRFPVEYHAVMDAIDRRIIAELAADGRISATKLAERIPLSLSATAERLRRLTDGGVVRRITVELDPAAVGRTIDALVDVRLGAGVEKTEADDIVRGISTVVDAVHVTGRFDYQLRVAARDVQDLDEVLTQLRRELRAEETNTRLVLRTLDELPRIAPLD